MSRVALVDYLAILLLAMNLLALKQFKLINFRQSIATNSIATLTGWLVFSFFLAESKGANVRTDFLSDELKRKSEFH